MKCNFVVGQQVVCIDDDWPELCVVNGTSIVVRGTARVPMLNEILTIAEIVSVESPIVKEQLVALIFHEIAEGWDHTHFAPLETRKTDISIFQRMLTPAGGVPVDA